jgi:hypothetical protein
MNDEFWLEKLDPRPVGRTELIFNDEFW